MLAVPLPFVVTMMLCVLAGSLWLQKRESVPSACWFLLMCAATTTIVGLRWTLDWTIFRALQPISASIIPVAAWWVFAKALSNRKLSWSHAILPCCIILSALSYPLWEPPIDIVLTGEYVIYGVALLVVANNSANPPENVRLSDWGWAIQSKRVAGVMLLFSAVIDGAMSIDYMFADGGHALWILSLGHGLLIPILAVAVMCISVTTADVENSSDTLVNEEVDDETSIHAAESLLEEQAITDRIEAVLLEQQLYLDPNLTLARLARKAGIPARQISAAINKVAQQNISQWVNHYRIEHAKELLLSTDAPITQIYMDSGFQTKSNFHREFSRLAGVTPSVYRAQLNNH